MTNIIIQKLQNRSSPEELYRTFDLMSLRQLEETIRLTDLILRDQLSHHSQLLHKSMQSYHNMGSVSTIRQSFGVIEKYLSYIVKKHLPAHKRFFIALTEFFCDYISREKLEESVKNINRAYREISIYKASQIMNVKAFLEHLETYNLWVKTLSAYIPLLHEKHKGPDTALFILIPRLTLQASEYLTTQQQLKRTVELQMQNNQVIINDVLYILTISQGLIQNSISARQFFEQEYIGSIKIISKFK